MGTEAYAERIDELFKLFKADSQKGLSQQDASERLREHGRNALAHERKASVLIIFLRQFKSFIIYILLGAALVSYLIGDHVEFVVISLTILFIVLLSFLEEYKATRDMEALRKLSPRKARAVRDGKVLELLAEELVPGDILLLRRGDVVPADARLFSVSNLKVEEAALTGESLAVDKIAGDIEGTRTLAGRANMVFASTLVANGEGHALVVATGQKTEIGKISTMLGGVKAGLSPLQRRLDRLGTQFSVIILLVCLSVFFFGLYRGQPLGEILLLAVAVAVAGVPESLGAVIGVALSIGMKRMAKRGAIVKRLPAVETLGTCTVICTDKTGTLTQNKMTVERVYTADTEFEVTGQGFSPEGLFLRGGAAIDPKKHHCLSKTIEIGVLCNNAELVQHEGEWRIDGESTEGAFIVLAKKAGIDRVAIHELSPRIQEHPFDPERKCMSAIHLVKNQPMVYAKGAPEMLLAKCSSILETGRVRPLSLKAREAILAKAEEYATRGARVLALAYKEHRRKSYEIGHVESHLIFAGLVAIRDPPEPSAAEAVKRCLEAGIWVAMITGDSPVTGKAIAKEIGIYEEGDRVITGEELDKLSDEQFAEIVESVAVYARATPAHKLRIVTALQRAGNIVAMTGDGVNDAPALKKADIGVAMGKAGTEVAKESAEMIITDDNFATIVAAVEEGRTIYSNIRKFVYYLVAISFAEVMLILIATLLGVLPPLTPIMILFINLVTSDIPALGLALERSSGLVMRQRPRDPKEGILNDYLFFRIAEVIPLMVLGTIALYMWELVVKRGTMPEAQTMAFVAIIFFALFHAFNAKSFEESVFSSKTLSNWLLFLGIGVSVAATLLVVYWLPLRQVFGTVPLGAEHWIAVLLMASSVVFIVEIQKTAVASEIKERERMEIHPTRR